MSDRNIFRPKVSVVVPVFNMADYISESAESLFRQTLKEIEYIFIDDASVDNSIDILKDVIERFPERKSQIRIISHKENQGIAATRQEGIELATGDWIIHCDSDDVLDLDAYSAMVDAAEKNRADIVICDFMEFYPDGRTRTIKHAWNTIAPFQLLEGISGSGNLSIHGALWNKLIKRELYENVVFPKNVGFCEDVTALMQITTQNPDIKIIGLSSPFYKYRKSGNTLSSRDNEKMNREISLLIADIEKLKNNSDKIYSKSFNAKIISLLYRLCNSEYFSKDSIKPYQGYKESIDDCKALNFTEKLYLRQMLGGRFILGNLIKTGNKVGKKTIKRIKKSLGKV